MENQTKINPNPSVETQNQNQQKTQTLYKLIGGIAAANEYGIASMYECMWVWDERELRVS